MLGLQRAGTARHRIWQLIPKLTKLYYSNFIVRMLYKQMYWHSLLVSVVVRFSCLFDIFCMFFSLCMMRSVIVIINKRIYDMTDIKLYCWFYSMGTGKELSWLIDICFLIIRMVHVNIITIIIIITVSACVRQYRNLLIDWLTDWLIDWPTECTDSSIATSIHGFLAGFCYHSLPLPAMVHGHGPIYTNRSLNRRLNQALCALCPYC